MRVKAGKLYVMDAIYGMYTIELKTRKLQFLVKPTDVQPRLMFPDDLDITADGKTIYFSDATTRFPETKALYSILEGELTKYAEI